MHNDNLKNYEDVRQKENNNNSSHRSRYFFYSPIRLEIASFLFNLFIFIISSR